MSDKQGSNVERPDTFSAVLGAALDIVRWFIGLFTLTEEDRLAAGINTSYKSHDG